MALDKQIFDALNGLAASSGVATAFAVFFGSAAAYILLLAFFVILRKVKEPQRLFWLAALSVLVSRFFFLPVIQIFIHRHKPFLVDQVHQLIVESKPWSFPSGHATFFFALSAAVFCYDKRWGTAFFIVSFLMGVGRVIGGVHYPSDILGGALLGIGTVYLFRRWLDPTKTSNALIER